MKLRLLCAACSGIVLSAPGVAQDAPGIVYDCDTTPDHFSDLSLPAAAPFTVTGKVTLMAAHKSKSYVPMTRISVREASDGLGPPTSGWAGFEFVIVPAKDKKASDIKVISFSERKMGGENQLDVAGLPNGDDVDFTLSYDGSTVTVKVDGHEKHIAYTAAQPAVNIACSTGEFLYRDLKIAPTK